MATKKTPGKKLTKKEINYFKELLLKLKHELIHDIQNLASNPNSEDSDSRDMSGHVQHMADVATDMYDKEFNLRLASKDRELLQKIDEALHRIEEGSYGKCLGTGNYINIERLKAIPYAEYCREYQEELEKNER
ncbi:MAG: TraR/DksA family transcriptional regulator [Candidatus Omnitrophica bacterium]|nr:TraR/DksA family transcriptional regulator [Candidatus Omnitrophota bacterium]